MKQKGVSAKLQLFWRGPFYVVEQTSSVNYRLKSVRVNARVHNVVRASRMEPCYRIDARPAQPPDDLTHCNIPLDLDEDIEGNSDTLFDSEIDSSHLARWNKKLF